MMATSTLLPLIASLSSLTHPLTVPASSHDATVPGNAASEAELYSSSASSSNSDFGTGHMLKRQSSEVTTAEGLLAEQAAQQQEQALGYMNMAQNAEDSSTRKGIAKIGRRDITVTPSEQAFIDASIQASLPHLTQDQINTINAIPPSVRWP